MRPPEVARFREQDFKCDFAAEVRKKKMAARAVHPPSLAEGLPRSSTQIIVWNFPPTPDFTKCPFVLKVVVSRARNDRFAKWYSWPVPLAGILFSKVVSLRGKIDVI